MSIHCRQNCSSFFHVLFLLFIIVVIGLAGVIGYLVYALNLQSDYDLDIPESHLPKQFILEEYDAHIDKIAPVSWDKNYWQTVNQETTGLFFGVSAPNTIDLENVFLIPGGVPFGVRFDTEGVRISSITAYEKYKSPAQDAGVAKADLLVKINGTNVNSYVDALELITMGWDEPLTITLIRNGSTFTKTIYPDITQTAYEYRFGFGMSDYGKTMGMITFISPLDNTFGGFGHDVKDTYAGGQLKSRTGTVVEMQITAPRKGEPNDPGNVRGDYRENIGVVAAHTQHGIYGMLHTLPGYLKNVKPMPVGLREEVIEGSAEIWTTVSEAGLKKYKVEVIEIPAPLASVKNFKIKTIDKELLELSGGIMYGMSGSPVIQSGKIIGAVSHVEMADPSVGYCVFVENMLTSVPGLFQIYNK